MDPKSSSEFLTQNELEEHLNIKLCPEHARTLAQCSYEFIQIFIQTL
ncbi:MAG: hypothetical protein ACO306_06630 [Flavobacteriaceae bacterium]